MIQRTYLVKDKAGLHARPISSLCNVAENYSGTIDLMYNENRYTLKSIM